MASFKSDVAICLPSVIWFLGSVIWFLGTRYHTAWFHHFHIKIKIWFEAATFWPV